MQMNVKNKFSRERNPKNRQYSQILNGRTSESKFASFGGGKTRLTPWFYRRLAIKKAPLAGAQSRKKMEVKKAFFSAK